VPLERELKLGVAPRAAPALARSLKLPARGRVLHSVYFDTPRRELRRRRMAVRVRRDGRRWLQTVKGARSIAIRNEWETAVAARRLDLGRLPLATIRRATGADLVMLEGKLRPVFETRFTRRARRIRRGDATIELALDRGYVRAGRRRAVISELELELKAGPMRALRREATALARRFQLVFLEESKAARGYRLADGA
jgi:inorganic triphosphatase YgiF